MATRAGATQPSNLTREEEETPGEDYRSMLSAVETVPIRSLLPADSPRSTGEDIQHVRLLSELETALPPIIVHRSTMRVVDGTHRLRAAALRGEKTIPVRFFDGDEHDAFVFAVKENISHGLPLAVGDRIAAAERIIRSHPHWSDRVIARVAGLSARTVGGIRRTAVPGEGQPVARIGYDGRVRPLDSSAGRIRAAELLAKEPGTSLRQVARQAGISPGTVRDVRDRLRRGEDPVPDSLRPTAVRSVPAPRNRPATSSAATSSRVSLPAARTVPMGRAERGRAAPLTTLIKDPSLRSGERGRLLLRLLSVSASLTRCWEKVIDAVPEHCAPLVCQVARESAATWAEFARDLEQRTARAEK